MPDVPYQMPFPGVFVVHYKTADDLDPDRQGALVQQVRTLGAASPVVIIFVLDPSVWKIDPKIPSFWLGVTGDKGIKLRGMAIVSASMAVRVAASGFGVTNTLRDVSVAVKAFTEAKDAIAWGCARVVA